MIERINRDFVCFWKNIRPGQKFPDEWGPGDQGKYLADQLPNGTAPDNICSLFCTPEGTVLHAVSGYWKAVDYLSELELAVSLSRLAPDDRAQSHSKRAMALPSTDSRVAIHEALGRASLRSIEDVLKSDKAGIR